MARERAGVIPKPDLTELEGRTYSCLEGCALCCLCQPELLPKEERAFTSDPELGRGVVNAHISPEVRGAALRLKGSHGVCHFLTERRCTIYDRRPHFCRSFPLNVFVGWRIQLNANLSCRGLDLPGVDLSSLGIALLSEYGNKELSRELTSAAKVFAQFEDNANDASVSQSIASVRKAVSMLGDELTDDIGLSRLMTYAEYGNTAQESPPADLVRAVREVEPEADIHQRALIDGVELFDLADLSHLPVYVAPDLSWKLFKLEGGSIVGWELDDSGETGEFSKIDPTSVDLLPMTTRGRKALRKYIDIVNARDCFLGHAAYLCDLEGYEFNFGQVYIGAIANCAVDLWWRASLLAQLADAASLDHDEIREGVVFFDMDMLDLPSIGAFI